MELLTSKKFKLPVLYFITDRAEIKDIPIGVPFIMGNGSDKKYFIQLFIIICRIYLGLMT